MKENVKQFKRIVENLSDLYEKKNQAYDDSFSQTFRKLGIISAVTRISDKTNRLCNLSTNTDVDNLGESIVDTLRDLACYSVMTLIELENSYLDEMKKINEEIKDMRTNNKNITEPIKEGDELICVRSMVDELNNSRYLFRIGKHYHAPYNGMIETEIKGVNIRFDGTSKNEWTKYFKRIQVDKK